MGVLVDALRRRTALPAFRRKGGDAAARGRGTVATCLIPSVIASFLLQIPLFALAGVSRGLLRVTGSTDAFESVGDDDRRHGLVSALLYGGLDLGKIAGPVIGGLLANAWGIATMLQVVPLGLLALYLALAIPARRMLRPSPELP